MKKDFINKILTKLLGLDAGSYVEMQTVFSNFNWQLLAKLSRLALCFIAGVFIARYLGPYSYGQYSLVITFAYMFSPLLALASSDIVVHELLKNKTKQDVILSSALILKILGTVLMVVLCLVALRIFNYQSNVVLLVKIMLVGWVFKNSNLLESLFFSRNKHKYAAISCIIAISIVTVLRLVMICLGKSLIFFVLLCALEYFLVAMIDLFIYFRQGNRFVWSYQIDYVKKILRRSFPLLLAAISSLVYMRIDQLMIKGLLGFTELGLYSIAVNLSEAFAFVPNVAGLCLFPAIVASRNKSLKLYNNRLQKLFTLALIFSVIVSFIFTFLAPFIVDFFFGHQFKESINAFRILLCSFPFMALSSLSSRWLVAEHKEKFFLYRHLFGCLINILLNIIFIPLWGINGAALATLITWIAVSLVVDVLFVELKPLFNLKINSFLFRSKLYENTSN